ncbi:hypothetical protein QTP88_014561 [Uroleucon formosanum]
MSKYKSEVWKYFEKKTNGNAMCKVCGKLLRTSGNTSNLMGHLKKLHKLPSPSETNLKSPNKKEKAMSSYCTPGIRIQNNIDDPEPQTQETANSSNALPSDVSTYTQSPSGSTSTSSSVTEKFMKQPTLEWSLNKISSFSSGGQKHIKITEAIVYFICKDNQPFSVVEDIGFKKLMKEVAPLYKVPTRNTIKARILQRYDVVSSNFKYFLKEIEDITITTDIWSEMMTTKSYIGVTIHFIHSTKLCSAALGIFELSKSLSANYIAYELLNILNLWDIPKSKILAVVTDNDSTMLKAIKENFGENKHLRCFSHSINLVAEGSMKKVDGLLDLISKVRNIVKFIKRSVNCSDELRKLQEKDGDNVKKCILDVVTRWNSVYYMCKRFLELKEVVNQIVLKHINAPPMLNGQEIENIKQAVKILEILEKVTSEISGQKYATMSLVIPIISCINDNLSTMLPTSRIGVEFKNAITDEMKKRFEFIEKNYLLSVSTILDPRFKNIHFKDALALSKHLRFINSSINSLSSTVEDHLSTDSSDSAAEYGTTDLWGHHKNLARKSIKTYVDKTNLGNLKHLGPEITMYLSTPVSQLKTDPLITWEELKPMYPLIHKLATKYLSGVSTSVPSERLFSCASNTISKTRNRLCGKSASKLIFLNNLDNQFWLLSE